MRPNDADGIANSADPDQTAPRSSVIWDYTVCLDLSVQKFRNIRILLTSAAKVTNNGHQ